jgi:hypothetical protein
LWRRQNPRLAPDPLAGGEKREIIPDVLGLQLEYSDGMDWYETWGKVQGTAKADNSQKEQSNLDGLPAAVRITLLVDANPQSKVVDAQTGERTTEPPLVFKTVAFLNLAETLQDDNGTTSAASPTGASGGGNNGPSAGGGS